MDARAEPTTAEKIRLLPWQVVGGLTNAVFCMLTVFGSIFMLFMSELGLAKSQIGILLSIFPFCGLLALVVAPAVERAGYKRTFLTFFGLRKIAMAGIIATPWVLTTFSKETAFFYVAAVLLLFAVCRSIGETAVYAWQQELVPDSLRGKFGAINGLISTSCVIIAVALAGRMISQSEGLARFQVIFAVALFFGFVSVWASTFWPGGAPVQRTPGVRKEHPGILLPLRDPNFAKFLAGVGLVTLACGPLYQFFFLYVKEELGLPAGRVVWLEIAFYFGGMGTGYIWGWAADRFGAKPVMVLSVAITALLAPLMCAVGIAGLPVIASAAAVTFLWGVAMSGWGISLYRHLYVSIMPPEHKTQYTAVFYAWIGVVGGFGPLLAGAALDRLAGLQGSWWRFSISQYTPVFLAGAVILTAGAAVLALLKAEGQMPASEFVAMFFQGSPLRAARSSMRWYFARKEQDRISTAESLGDARSPLNVEELLEALADPSFNVRYEAIVSISRSPANERLIDALIDVLRGEESDLSAAAAWALSRIGSGRAVPALRDTLDSPYPVVRAQSARALAVLGDAESIPHVLECFRGEREEGVRIAFASALGGLRATDATRDLLAYLAGTPNDVIRKELVLALARMIGAERYHIRLWRAARTDFGTAVSQALTAMSRTFRRKALARPALVDGLARSADSFAQGDLEAACASLAEALGSLPGDSFDQPVNDILRECAPKLAADDPSREGCVLLAATALHSGLALLVRQGHPMSLPPISPEERPALA